MGDPKKQKKKYKTPLHPWRKERIEIEKGLFKKYGLKNKKEVWKSETKLRLFKKQAKRLIKGIGEQTRVEQEQLLNKLDSLNLLNKTAKLEEVLNLTLKNILDRRLQSFVYKLGLAKTIRQARQFVVHGNIFINNKKVDVPSYLIKKDEEDKIMFNPASTLSNPEHPERVREIKHQEKIEEVKNG